MQKYKISGNKRRKDVKFLNFCAFLGQNDTEMEIFRYLCVQNSIFLDKEPIVFRILLKHHINNTRMTKATKLTPSQACAFVVFNNIRVSGISLIWRADIKYVNT